DPRPDGPVRAPDADALRRAAGRAAPRRAPPGAGGPDVLAGFPPPRIMTPVRQGARAWARGATPGTRRSPRGRRGPAAWSGGPGGRGVGGGEGGGGRGLGLGEFEDASGAEAAMRALDGSSLGGRTIRVNEAIDRGRGGPGGGRGGPGGGRPGGGGGFRDRGGR